MVLWWPPLFALWMLFVGEWSWLIGVWGAAMALAAAVSASLVVEAGLLDARGRRALCREFSAATISPGSGRRSLHDLRAGRRSERPS
ncbi:hypothetical protein [Actinomadura meyerae]|uniref:hypothetical protein n=1 Tax=Actinomadura meyerae TaxID=240840 RepID=UPI001177EF6E|nr:hypothetical protein [Actinomadura meyerae]